MHLSALSIAIFVSVVLGQSLQSYKTCEKDWDPRWGTCTYPNYRCINVGRVEGNNPDCTTGFIYAYKGELNPECLAGRFDEQPGEKCGKLQAQGGCMQKGCYNKPKGGMECCPDTYEYVLYLFFLFENFRGLLNGETLLATVDGCAE
jgi:hypothetical protein